MVLERSLVLGVDAGSARTVAVLAELAEGKPQIIGCALVPCTGVRRGVVVDLEATAGAMKQAVVQACEMAGRQGITRAVIAISGSHVRSVVGESQVVVHRPGIGVTAEDVRRALDAAAAVDLPDGREVIHVVPRSYRLDEAEGIADPVGLAGRSLTAQAHLITGEALPVQNSLRAAVRAGLQVVDYQLAIRAAGQAVLTPEEREAGVLLLDIGSGTTSVAVYDRGHLWHCSVIPVGGDHITSDLASLLHIPLSLAEQIKRERGWAAADLCPEESRFELVNPSGSRVREVEDRQVAAIIESRVSEILQLAAETVKRSGYAGLFPAGLVLTGGGSRLQGLVGFAADSLGLVARLGTAEGPLVGEPEYAVAAGLVHWGARLAEDEAAAAAEAQSHDNWGAIRRWLSGWFR